jgi:hypothetical protein
VGGKGFSWSPMWFRVFIAGYNGISWGYKGICIYIYKRMIIIG